MLALRCTGEPEVSRDEYNRAIRDPIRAYLRQHDPKGQIRCIVLMWGVPVRVAGPPLTDRQKRLLSLYKARRERLLARMSVHVKLLEAVATAYPQPRTEGITPVGALFARDLNAVPTAKPNFYALRSQFDRVRKSTSAGRCPVRTSPACPLARSSTSASRRPRPS